MAFNIDFNTQEDKIISLTKKVEKLGDGATATSAKLQQAVDRISRLNKEAKDLTAVYQMASRASNALDKSTVKVSKSIGETGEKARTASAKVNGFSKSANLAAQETAAFRAAMNATGTHMGIFTSQTVLVAAAVYTVVASFRTMVETGINFTGAMTRALPIMGATAAQSKNLEQEVRRLGETTQFTATEAAEGLTALAMAGLTSAQAMKALSSTLNLAAIGQIDMYKSADILTNVMTGFRKEASDIVSITDDLATAITSSNSTIEQMANALSYVAPVAQAAGGSIEEVTAMLEVFHNAGIKSSRAGTSLRRAYSNLMSPTTKAAEVLGRLNIQTLDVNGSLNDMSDIMRQLADSGATANDVVSLFGVRAAPAMIALVEDMKGVNSQFDLFYRQLTNNEGAADELREKMEDNLGTDLRKLLSALQEQAIKLFDELEGGLRGTAQSLTEFVRSFSAQDIKDLAEGLKLAGSALEALVTNLDMVISLWAGMKGLQLIKFIGSTTAATQLWSKATKSLRLSAMGATMLATSMEGLSFATKASTAAQMGYVSSVDLVKKSFSLLKKAAVGVGLAISRAFWPLAAVTAIGGAVYYLWNNTDTAAKKVKKLTKEQIDAKKAQDDWNASIRKSNELLFSALAAGKAPSKQQKQVDIYDGKIEDIGKKIGHAEGAKVDAKQFWVDKLNSGDVRGAVEAQKKYNEAVRIRDEEIKGLVVQLNDIVAQRTRYIDTGLTQEGIQANEMYDKALEKLREVSLSDQLKTIVAESKTDLAKIKAQSKSGDLNIVTAMYGTTAEIKQTMKEVGAAYLAEKKKLEDAMAALDKDSTGRPVNKAKGLEIQEDLLAVDKEYADVLEKLEKQLAGTSAAYDTYVMSQQKLLDKGVVTLAQKREELELAKRGEKVIRSSEATARILQVEKNKAIMDGLSIASEEYKQLAAKNKLLLEQADAFMQIAKAMDTAKRLNSDAGLSGQQKLNKARDEELKELAFKHENGIAILEGYEQRKLEIIREFETKKRELREETLRKEHETWFAITDIAAQSIGENLSQVALLDQSWQEAGKNIQRAIVGGIIQSLVEVGIKQASLHIAETLFAQESVATTAAAETAKTSVKTAAHAAEIGMLMAELQLQQQLGVAQAAANPWAVGAQMAAMTAISAFMSSLGSSLAGSREIGGSVQAGQSYLVGEKGPEIFTPTFSGGITSNADIKRKMAGEGSGSQEVHNHYYDQSSKTEIHAVDTQSFRSALARDPSFVAQVVNKANKRMGKHVK